MPIIDVQERQDAGGFAPTPMEVELVGKYMCIHATLTKKRADVGWTVTHIASGFAVTTRLCSADCARQAAQAFEAIDGMPWHLESFKELEAAVPRDSDPGKQCRVVVRRFKEMTI